MCQFDWLVPHVIFLLEKTSLKGFQVRKATFYAYFAKVETNGEISDMDCSFSLDMEIHYFAVDQQI